MTTLTQQLPGAGDGLGHGLSGCCADVTGAIGLATYKPGVQTSFYCAHLISLRNLHLLNQPLSGRQPFKHSKFTLKR